MVVVKDVGDIRRCCGMPCLWGLSKVFFICFEQLAGQDVLIKIVFYCCWRGYGAVILKTKDMSHLLPLFEFCMEMGCRRVAGSRYFYLRRLSSSLSAVLALAPK